ncbi:integral membrane protein [Streptomyces lincolnensis]|uniref:Integral membrane protein n=1 Tax=Streptomyces lincolnensis TaxID=1915 RepID=A0A1B1M8B2_STRLN|nr:integral membrane protein [Streptomyces lincolnensis]AXG56921.1 integral membrane protein [Streptomyces lincolnensis]
MVIGAAVLLFIASFLDIYSIDGVPDGYDLPSLWASGPVVLGVVLAGIIGAALVVVSHGLPQVPKVAGLDLGQFGVAFTVFAAWSALGNIFDPAGGANNGGSGGGSAGPDAGIGLILALIATLVMAAAALATPLVPALKAALVPAPKPPQPQPYGAQPPGGYGYPGAPQPGQPGPGQPGQPYGGQPQPGQPFGGQPQQAQPPAPAAAEFSPFWFAVPVPRPLFAEDGSPTPIAELAPGTWYLAVEQRGPALVAQTQDGRRGVLQDTSGIQRG